MIFEQVEEKKAKKTKHLMLEDCGKNYTVAAERLSTAQGKTKKRKKKKRKQNKKIGYRKSKKYNSQ